MAERERKLTELRDKVRQAQGADRFIDADLALLAGLPQEFFISFEEDIDGYPFGGFAAVDGPACFDDARWGGGGRSWEAEDYTASADAALGLVERMLPGWTVATIGQQDDKTWFCELREGYRTSYTRVAMSDRRTKPPTAPLAILDALLSALSQHTDTPAARAKENGDA
jgi:hypothetical protein